MLWLRNFLRSFTACFTVNSDPVPRPVVSKPAYSPINTEKRSPLVGRRRSLKKLLSFKSTCSADNDFQIDRLEKSLEASINNPKGICIDEFLICSIEIGKLLPLLGQATACAASSLDGYISVLKRKVESYTLQKLVYVEDIVKYEVSHGIHDTGKKNSSASRAISRLVYLLELVYGIAIEMEKTPQKPLSKCISRAYKLTISKHHPWIVRKAVMSCVKLTPTKTQFLSDLHLSRTDVSSWDKEVEFLRCCQKVKVLHKRVQEIFSEFGIKQLK